jgi:hypothetical protein
VVPAGSVSIQSLTLDEFSDVSLVLGGGPVNAVMKNASGDVVAQCSANCLVNGLEPDDYFIGFNFATDIDEFSYSLSW